MFLINRIRKKHKPDAQHPTLKCPNCGSSVQIKGIHWECSYCGNSGILKTNHRYNVNDK